MSNREVLRKLLSELRSLIAEATKRIDVFDPVHVKLLGVRKISELLQKQFQKFYSNSK